MATPFKNYGSKNTIYTSGAYSMPGKTLDNIYEYVCMQLRRQTEIFNQRERMRTIDGLYMREMDQTSDQAKAKLANKAKDPTKLQNMQTPTVMTTVESHTGFLTKVFASDYPMFEFVAGREFEDAALALNTLVGEDQVTFGWLQQLNMLFRDGAKYNLAASEVTWEKQLRYKPVTKGQGVAVEEEIYAGNRIKRLDPYNLIKDPRVNVWESHLKAEYSGYMECIQRIELIQRLHNLGPDRFKRDREAYESSVDQIAGNFYTPQVNWNVILNSYKSGEFNWASWFGIEPDSNGIQYRDMYYWTVVYARVLPYEFGMRGPNDQTPDIWKFVLVNSIVVWAQPVKETHNVLPLLITQPLCDGLDIQTKSMAENVGDYQFMESALWNAKLQSSRRMLTDRVLYNPLFIDPDHMNSPNPGAKIPVKPAAYGRKLEEAVYQFPFRNENSQFWSQDIQMVSREAMRAAGQNNVTQGQFQKGNKLQDEFQTVMANAGIQDQVAALTWECQFFQPVKDMLKQNYLQFAKKSTRFNRKLQQSVPVDPNKLREMIGDFKVGDGLLPAQKQVSAQVLQIGLQTLEQVPALAAEYEVGDLFAHMMKLQGATDFMDFKKDPATIAYNNAVASWQQTVQMLYKQNPDQDPNKLPPQPKPTDYGLQPNGKPIPAGQQQPASAADQLAAANQQAPT